MNVLEELTEFEDRIDRAHVERRVGDWEQRISGLYRAVESWLPSSWTSKTDRSLSMDEPLMQRFGVAERQLPILCLLRGRQVGATLEPRRLWTIGANGRVDLVRGDDRYVIVDSAENLEPPRWKVSPFFSRREQEDLTRAWLARVLA